MAGETDNPEDAAARLEAALERIAQRIGSHPAGDPLPVASVPGDAPAEPTGPEPPVEEIAAQLDGLIDRLRAALNTASGGRPG